MEYKKLVREHYKKEAEKDQLSINSTMADLNTRRLEIKNIVAFLKANKKCLEVGCGNGAASIEISKSRKLDLLSVDFSPEMIALAKKQPTFGAKGKIKFQEEDVLELKYKNIFDFVFTERCVINLLNQDDQKKALKNMADALKPGGSLILLEAFDDGFQKLNSARKNLGLEPIAPAYHNLYLDKDFVIGYLKSQNLEFVKESKFLSSYFFGSRVIYPFFAKAVKKDIKYNTAFSRFFSFLPSFGNYSQIKILLFKKIKK
ncbi:MAG: class I SAM-dependent methyltransferase [Candidatus Staskawiczbacteria bacterium]|nr:class I SAM-dependent methyltransferase [Candidatus Staskawiczbacteria bacterium]